MIALTSLSPTHINGNIQQKAVDSWRKLGLHAYSFNHPSERESILKYKGIRFVNTEKTAKHIFGKHYVLINEMIDYAPRIHDDGMVCFINSDIELDFNPDLLNKIKRELDNKMVICHRQDYDKSKRVSQPYVLGIDAFFVHTKYLHIFPPSLFSMGNCFWDYNMPFTAMKNGLEVINLQNKFAFHKVHPVQYSVPNWEITGKMFAMEHGLDGTNIGRLNELAFNFLKLNTKKVTL
jgi:hypothetical protein